MNRQSLNWIGVVAIMGVLLGTLIFPFMFLFPRITTVAHEYDASLTSIFYWQVYWLLWIPAMGYALKRIAAAFGIENDKHGAGFTTSEVH